MYKKLAEITVSKSADYYDKVINVLERAGFVIMLVYETTSDRCYVVAESEDKK